MRFSIAIIIFAFFSMNGLSQFIYAGWPVGSDLFVMPVAEYSKKPTGFTSLQDGVVPVSTLSAKANSQSDLSENSFVGDIAYTEQVGASVGGCVPRSYGYPDLFYNYYTQGFCNTSNAQMYLCPRPVPPVVGNTYFTYQPWYPEEMLYWHKNRYHNYYDGGRGTNHTRVVYMAPPIRTAWSNLYWNKLRVPR